jgi:uncharacterized protein (DUF885 family)
MPAKPDEIPANAATKSLYELFASEWDYQMERNPTWASMLGDRRWNGRWPDVSPEAIARDHQHSLEVLQKLEGIDRGALTPGLQLNYDLFKRDYAMGVEEYPYRWYLVPLNQRGGIQTANELSDQLRFETSKDYEDWVARLRSFSVYMNQTMELMREGIRARMLLPKIVMQRVPAQIDKQIVAAATDSPFYAPFKRFPSSISAAEQGRLTTAARTTIENDVVPAFQHFKQFFVYEYLPASFDQVGAWQMPNGREMYALFARRYTTTNMTPEEIHQTGLDEVERIRGEMEASKEKAGYQGSLNEFFQFLRTDPRFHYNTPEELLTAYRALAKRIDPNLVKVFRTLPRLPYGVEPIPEAVAPDTTAAYYSPGAADGSRAGTYYVNLYKPEARPKWEMVALSLHESVPGHHLQIALAMEQRELPNFRRYGQYDAFVEGWALYAESLGQEMGLYDNPYVEFGRLTYEMWRAVRLVVDTGMHLMRWDRQRAIDYFMENAAKTELDVVNEIDRYIAWPGQALAYKIGQLQITGLRRRASEALGESFDLREFHDVVLSQGPLPLDVLARNVDDWIKNKTAPHATDLSVGNADG